MLRILLYFLASETLKCPSFKYFQFFTKKSEICFVVLDVFFSWSIKDNVAHSSRKAHEYCRQRGGEKKASICIGCHSSAPLNSVDYSDFCPDRATMATIFSPPVRPPVSSWRETRCKQRILPAPAREKRAKKAKKVDTRISDAPVG